MHYMLVTQYAVAGYGSTASLLYTSDFILHTSYHHALHAGDAVRRSRLRLYGISTLYFILRITMHCMLVTQYAVASYGSTASLLYTSDFILHTSFCATMMHVII
jgi:hypothetical protein